MEPLTPNDPLWKVLGQAKRVEVRPNFAQNVVRLARQTPQDRGWLARLKSWWQDLQDAGSPAKWTWIAATAAVVLAASSALLPYVSENGATSTLAVNISVEVIAPEKVALTPEPAASVVAAATEVDFPLMPEFETEWQNLEQMGDLLAVHDTALLTDSEINLLLY